VVSDGGKQACLALGGDHITTISPWGYASPCPREKLKLKRAVASSQFLAGEYDFVNGRVGLCWKEIEREMLNSIIHLRVREGLELLKRGSMRSRISLIWRRQLHYRWVSLLNGIDHLGENFRNTSTPAHARPLGRHFRG